MPDEVKQPEGVTDDQPKAKTEAEIEAEIAAKYEQKYKAEIQGLNRANSQAKKELDEIKSASMTAEEKAKKYLEEAETAKKEAEQYQRSLIITKGLTDAGLPLEFAKRVSGDNAEEITADIAAFKAYLDSEVKRISAAEINAKLSGDAPKGGNPPAAGSKVMALADFNQLDAKAKAAFMASGGTLKD